MKFTLVTSRRQIVAFGHKAWSSSRKCSKSLLILSRKFEFPGMDKNRNDTLDETKCIFLSESSISALDNDLANFFEPNWIFWQKATFSFIQCIMYCFCHFRFRFLCLVSVFTLRLENQMTKKGWGFFASPRCIFARCVSS